MKAYVLDYGLTPEPGTSKTKISRGGEKPPQYEVLFGHKPDWSLGAISLAKAECDFLNSLKIHVGQHRCHFEIEEVRRSVFAIVCKDHPRTESDRSSKL